MCMGGAEVFAAADFGLRVTDFFGPYFLAARRNRARRKVSSTDVPVRVRLLLHRRLPSRDPSGEDDGRARFVPVANFIISIRA